MEPLDLRKWPGFIPAGGASVEPAIVNQISIDSRRIDSSHTLFVALKGQLQNGHHFVSQAAKAGARYALVQKDWLVPQPLENITLLRVDDPLIALQELAALYRQELPTKVIGITGSYGKTMLKDLLHALLSTTMPTMSSPESFNSQLGVPLSLFHITKEDHIAIIEAGISLPKEMTALARMIAPNYGIITNIGNAHTATLKDLKTTAKEKIQLLKYSSGMLWALMPNDALIHPHLSETDSFMSYYWNEVHSKLPHARYNSSVKGSLMPYTLSFPTGREFHGEISSGFSYFLDLLNIAVKAAWLLEVSDEAICNALKIYTPEPMRTEIWKSPLGTTIINASYSSDPQSVDLALRHFQNTPAHKRKIFAFGGLRSSAEHLANDYRQVGKIINQAGIDLLMLFDKHDFSPLLAEVARQSPHTKIEHFSTYQEMVLEMSKSLQQNDIAVIKGAKKESLTVFIKMFNESISNNLCLVDLGAVQRNIETIRQKLTSGSRIMVMVKAAAYGTDDIRMTKFLASYGIDIFGVSYVEEGITLKREGIKQSIFVLNAAIYEVSKAVKWGLEVGVSDHEMIQALATEAALHDKKVKVHLHVNTGMGRFGCRQEECLELAKQIQNSPGLILEGIMTHLACADDPEEDAFTLSQIENFDQIIVDLEKSGITAAWYHAANSSGVMRFNFYQYNMVRVGLAIYGFSPSPAANKSMELHPAISLISRIVGINICLKGETVSYARTYTAQRECERIAVIPIGYFDGLHRQYSSKGHVIIRGQKAPMVGRICMDYMMVNVSDIPEVEVGDAVLIFGTDEHGQYVSPEELAQCGSTIVYELATCLGPRIQRVFINQV